MRNLKRALSLALAAVMVLSMMVVGAGAVSVDDFSDGADIVNKEAVTVLASLNVINGKDDGSYDPTGIVTRAEMAKMICVVLNGGRDPQLGAVVADSYTDTVNHWAKAYIEYCTNLGIVAGRGDGTFAPNDTVTMAEAAKMLLVAIGYNADIEGYVGANWQINTDVKANQEDLYEGITATNTSVDLTRDNAAQMVYNALECQMVKYEYVVTTDGSMVTTKPQVTTEGLGNVLQEKFGASKVEAIVVSNEVAALNNSYTSADDEGETTLEVLAIDGVKTNAGSGTYKVSTDKDLLGQNVVVYVQYKNTVGYDESTAVVIGTPIPTSQNKVVVSTDGTEVADVADDNKLELAADTEYYVNYGGYYGGVVYGDDRAKAAADKVVAADKDNKVSTMTEAQFDYAAACTGVTVTLIDNDGDKKVDYALAEKYSYGTVNKYATGDDAALRVQGLFKEGEYKAENVVGFDDVALNDQVLFCEYGGKLYVQKPETVEAKLDSYSTSKKNVKLDGETIKWSGLNGTVSNDQSWVGDYVTTAGVLNTTAVYHKDVNGYIFAVSETDEALLTYAVLLGFENQTGSTSGNLGQSARARLLMADGTVATYDVSTINGKKVTNCTGGTATSRVPANASEVGFALDDQYNIYSYSLTEGGAVKLVDRTDLNKTASQSAGNKNATVNYESGKSVITVGGSNYTVSDRTIFLYSKTDGSTVRYQGRTAPGIDSTEVGNVEIVVRASTRGEALVLFFNNTNPSADFKDNWAYVYNTKVAQNGDSFEVSAIIDGKIETYMVDAAYDAYGNQVIQPDVLAGSYYHTMPVGLYNYSLDDGIYTLDQSKVTTNSVSGTVFAVGTSTIRITLSSGAQWSYTLTNDTLLFEARKNKTAQSIPTVSKGDKVTLVYNDDGEVVYGFLTQYSYESTTSTDPTPDGTYTGARIDPTDAGKIDILHYGATAPALKEYASLIKAMDADIESVSVTSTTAATVTYKNGTTVAYTINTPEQAYALTVDGTISYYANGDRVNLTGMVGNYYGVKAGAATTFDITGTQTVDADGKGTYTMTAADTVIKSGAYKLSKDGTAEYHFAGESVALTGLSGKFFTMDGGLSFRPVDASGNATITMPNAETTLVSNYYTVSIDGGKPTYVANGDTVTVADKGATGYIVDGDRTKYAAYATDFTVVSANAEITTGYYGVTVTKKDVQGVSGSTIFAAAFSVGDEALTVNDGDTVGLLSGEKLDIKVTMKDSQEVAGNTNVAKLTGAATGAKETAWTVTTLTNSGSLTAADAAKTATELTISTTATGEKTTALDATWSITVGNADVTGVTMNYTAASA